MNVDEHEDYEDVEEDFRLELLAPTGDQVGVPTYLCGVSGKQAREVAQKMLTGRGPGHEVALYNGDAGLDYAVYYDSVALEQT
ncbi:MAG: hypothetical protein J2P19_00315 [Pseudonocardia sp.]|nr:hypothetical protein [Pseudonocardia sp.]